MRALRITAAAAFAAFALTLNAQEDGLELYISFNANQPNDESGNGRDGELAGSANLIDGVVQKAWEFDGSTVINLLDQIFKDPDPELSVRFYMKPDDMDGQRIIFDEGGAWTGFTVRILDGMLQFGTVCCGADHPPPEIAETDAPDDGEWHEIAAVFGQGQMFLYVDGIEVDAVKTDWQELSGHGQPAAIGHKSPGDTAFGGGNGFYSGGLDEFRLYSRMLSANEVALNVSPAGRLALAWGEVKSSGGSR